MVKFFAFFLLGGLFWSLAAPAATEWQLREIRQPNGALDYCVSEQSLPDGRRINLAIDIEGKMNLGLVQPSAPAMKGDAPVVGVAFDKAPPLKLPARALSPALFVVDIPNPEAWNELWQKTKQLTITGLGAAQRFALGDGRAMLGALQDCAAQKQADFPPALQDVLQRAGLWEGLTLLPPPAAMGFVDFAWRRGRLNGGTQAFAPAPDFRTAVRGQLAVFRNYCQGLWSEDVELILVIGAAQQQQGILTCHAAGRDEVMSVLFHAPGDGTARYFTFAGMEADRAELSAATAALAKALRSMP